MANQPFMDTQRIHGAAIYGNMDPINIPPMLALIYQHHGSYGISMDMNIFAASPRENG